MILLDYAMDSQCDPKESFKFFAPQSCKFFHTNKKKCTLEYSMKQFKSEFVSVVICVS